MLLLDTTFRICLYVLNIVPHVTVMFTIATPCHGHGFVHSVSQGLTPLRASATLRTIQGMA
ncbi:MAG: hypothetical protein U9Q29_04065 [Campylobacterota bacterium]|nr:hypothetical protein [Campylobacterota bacterium]